MKKLVVISHTEHQRTTNGSYVGFGPTVNEINFLSRFWDEIVHVACLENKDPKGNSVPYSGGCIKFIPIPTFGGRTWWSKFAILFKVPKVLSTVHKATRNASHIQLRLPMGIGIFLIFYFLLIKSRSSVIWVKYANNWSAKPASISYAIQRWLLKRNILNCKVTINGYWEDQPKHCISFENPSLTDEQHVDGIKWIEGRKFHDGPYTIVFIGRVEYMKGIDLVVNTLGEWPIEKISHFHVIGEGKLLHSIKESLDQCGITNTMHGFLPTGEVYEILKQADFLILPSRSEGFPKVITEALNYGCVPIVTNVGSIPHYVIDNINGYVISKIDEKSFLEKINFALHQKGEIRKRMVFTAKDIVDKFTFTSYIKKLKENILYAF